jgi:lipopolysaccharide transport system permease protein
LRALASRGGIAWAPVAVVYNHWHLATELAKREVAARYRGSVMGLAWSLLQPLLLLGLYTFVFGTIFNMKAAAGHDQGQFAIIVFAGLIVHGLFAECVTRAPGLVLANANYVKKVVFPLEVLPLAALLAALFHTHVSLLVLALFVVVESHALPVTVLLAPLVLLPLALLTLGLSWFLASVGVYLRDVGQTIGLVTTALLFLSPVFYPASAVPAHLRPLLEWNFLTPVIEAMRAVMILGRAPDWWRWSMLLVVGLLCSIAGLYWFQRSRRGFADVI